MNVQHVRVVTRIEKRRKKKEVESEVSGYRARDTH